MPEDLSLHFRLWTDLSEQSPDGPGWYLAAHRHDAMLINPVRLNQGAIDALGAVLDQAVSDREIPLVPTQLIGSGTHLIKQAVNEQLQKAEAQAKRIAKLRRLAAENATVDDPTEKEESISNDV